MNEVQKAKRRGWPITMQDILMERVQFEDRLCHAGAAEVEIPERVNALPEQRWSETALHVFTKNMYRFSMSLFHP